MLKKLISITLITILSTMLVGCDIQIFEDKNAKYRLKEVSKDELEQGTYYVKEGTKFYKVHECDNNSSSQELNKTKVTWTIKDEQKIPPYYKGEIIAYPSVEAKLDEVNIERYKDVGYSLGLYEATFTEDGYISFTHGNNTINKTDASKKFENKDSSNILIESINGKPVNESMLNEAGVIVGLEKDKAYEIAYYAGTKYATATIIADTHFFQSYEAYKIEDYEITKNGYMSIEIPENYKSGIYRINGAGLFKYYDFKKGEKNIETADMNVPFYTSEAEQLAAFSQQFTFELDVATKNASVVATYDVSSLEDESTVIKMMITSPDGKQMIIDADKNSDTIKCDMQTSMAGKWIVNISPQTLNVSNVEIKSNEEQAEATKEVYNITMTEPKSGIIFFVEYEGEGEVTAQVVDGANKSYDMVKDENNEHKLIYNFSYIAPGPYQIYVYHYPDTKITEATYEIDENSKNADIITIEE